MHMPVRDCILVTNHCLVTYRILLLVQCMVWEGGEEEGWFYRAYLSLYTYVTLGSSGRYDRVYHKGVLESR